MSASSFTGPRVLRLVGFTDFVVALVCLATPLLRAPLGSTMAYTFSAFLLAGSAMSFVLARYIERRSASPAAAPATASRATLTMVR